MPSIPPEAQQIANDPSFAVQFAIGDPFPQLVPQNPSSQDAIRLRGVYFNEPKRYLLKKAHFSMEDRRIFDVETGLVVLVSSHLGKNPYESIDPLGYNESQSGEWKSITDVNCVNGNFPSFKIRPKKLSRHGTQYVDLHGDDEDVVFNVAKMSKLKSKSMRPHFVVGKYKDAGKGKHMVYKLIADVIGRTLAIENSRGELIAQMAKTNKAMLKTAVFGSGSESTIDIAPGVDCSTILAIIFAVGQVGRHYVKDMFHNFVVDPMQDSAVEGAMNTVTGNGPGLGSMVSDAGSAAEGFADNVGLGDHWDGAEEMAGDAMEGLADAAGGIGDFFVSLFGGED